LPSIAISVTTVDCPQAGFKLTPSIFVYASLKIEITFASANVGVGAASAGDPGTVAGEKLILSKYIMLS